MTYILIFLELHIPYCLFKVNISHCNIFTIFFLTLPYCDDVIIGGDSLIQFHKWWEGHRVHIKKTVQSPLNVINIARLQRRIQKLVKHLRWGLLKKFCKRLQRRYLPRVLNTFLKSPFADKYRSMENNKIQKSCFFITFPYFDNILNNFMSLLHFYIPENIRNSLSFFWLQSVEIPLAWKSFRKWRNQHEQVRCDIFVSTGHIYVNMVIILYLKNMTFIVSIVVIFFYCRYHYFVIITLFQLPRSSNICLRILDIAFCT